MLHGYAENGTINFEKIALQAVKQGHEVYVIDWPGHGESDKINNIPFYAETRRDYSEACLEFFRMIEKEHPQGVDVLVHSMGGAILASTLGAPEGQKYQKLIHTLILSAPMFALKGMGYVSELLYASPLGIGKTVLSVMARLSRKPKPFNFPLQDLTEDPEEQQRILERQRLKVSDYLVNSESDWILAANEMMTHVAKQTSTDWKNFKGQAILWASPNDKITDGPRSIQIFKKLFPKGMVQETSRPHRIHTHPEVEEEILKSIS